jgi:2-oxoglutarate ferredoxin oxidoreductase subunit beta
MLYVLENNGVYGLTKGQFSASADVGSTAKRGAENQMRPIDPASLALALGASFVARSFSGDKKQLVPIIKAGLAHQGFALVDVISPCVTFNDHEGSTKSYAHTREHGHEVVATDFVPLLHEIQAEQNHGSATAVQMHDGSVVRFRSVNEAYDPTDRDAAYAHLKALHAQGEVATGLLFIDPTSRDLHALEGTVDQPLVEVPFEKLCPGSTVLNDLQARWR